MRISQYAIVIASLVWTTNMHSAEYLSRDKALAVAREGIQKQGIDIAKYKLNPFKKELGNDGKEWMFLYECKRQPSPPGCFFWVLVDRTSGNVKVMPGE